MLLECGVYGKGRRVRRREKKEKGGKEAGGSQVVHDAIWLVVPIGPDVRASSPAVGQLRSPACIHIVGRPSLDRVQDRAAGCIECTTHCFVPSSWVNTHVVNASIVPVVQAEQKACGRRN